VDALWHVLIYAISSLVLFAEADWRLMIPLLTWIVAYIGALYYFVPRVKERSVDLLRCALQTDGAHRRRLHQHHHPEAVRPHLRTAIRPRSIEQTEKTQLAGRVVTSMDVASPA
jgi:ATP-binding cassette subfamily B multidrug efflux pump